MAIGNYGVNRASDVNIEDIDMYYNYAPDRQTINTDIIPLTATELLSYLYLPSTDPNYIPVIDPSLVENSNILEGLYNLRLPAAIFNQLGIYTIYIKPKLIMTTIVDCGVLSSLPNDLAWAAETIARIGKGLGVIANRSTSKPIYT